MDSDVAMIVFRGAERLMLVAASSLLVWLGYRLFALVPVEQRADGRFEMPGVKVTLSKVGPGVLFALFGAFGLYKAITTQISVPIGPHKLQGIMAVDHGDAQQAAHHAATDVKVLNCLATAPPAGVSRNDVEVAVWHAKTAILAESWLPSWKTEELDGLRQMRAPHNAELAAVWDGALQECK